MLEWSLFGGPRLPFVIYGVMALAAIIGLVDRARHLGAWAAWLLGAPPLAAVLAAALRRYPLSARTLLFAVPILILLAIDGLWLTLRSIAPRWRVPATAVAALALLICPTMNAMEELHKLATPDSAATGMANVHRWATPTDAVYIFGRDVAAWTVATTDWTHTPPPRVDWYMDALTHLGPNPGNAPSRGGPVPDSEGTTLVWHAPASAPEIVGVPTGMEQIYGDFIKRTPDSGWVAHEAHRILAQHPSTAWLFFTSCDYRPCDQQLADTLAAHGGRLVYRRVDPAAAVYGVRY